MTVQPQFYAVSMSAMGQPNPMAIKQQQQQKQRCHPIEKATIATSSFSKKQKDLPANLQHIHEHPHQWINTIIY